MRREMIGEHIKERSELRGYYARGVLSFMVFGILPVSFILRVLLEFFNTLH